MWLCDNQNGRLEFSPLRCVNRQSGDRAHGFVFGMLRRTLLITAVGRSFESASQAMRIDPHPRSHSLDQALHPNNPFIPRLPQHIAGGLKEKVGNRALPLAGINAGCFKDIRRRVVSVQEEPRQLARKTLSCLSNVALSNVRDGPAYPRGTSTFPGTA